MAKINLIGIPEHAQAGYVIRQQRYESETAIQALADRLVEQHGLAVRAWECDDERREVIGDLAAEAAHASGFDSMQAEYLEEQLFEQAARAE